MKFLTNLTLAKKIIFLTALGLALGGVVFSGVALRAVNQATETMLQDRLTTAQLVSDYIDEALGRAVFELETAARTIDGAADRSRFDSLVATLEDRFTRLSIYTHSIYLVGEDGQILWSKPQSPARDLIELSPDSGLTEVIGRQEISISGLVSAFQGGAPVVFLSSPTREWRQGDRGMLIVAIDLTQSSIGGFVRPIMLGKTGYVELVDQNGMVLARTEPGPKLAPFEKSDHSGRFTALMSAGKPTRGVCHTCHEPEQKVERKDVLAFVPLSQAQWGVVIRQSEEEALAPIRELRQNLLSFGIGLVVIALLFVFVTTRDVGGRLRRLTAASRRMAGGDLSGAVTVEGRDEVSILGNSLDDMRVKLKTSYGALEQKTKELASLLSVSEILTSTFDLGQLLDAVLAKSVEVIPAADAGVLLLGQGGQADLKVQSSIGLDKGLLAQLIISQEEACSPRSLPESPAERQRSLCDQVVSNCLQSGILQSRVKGHACADVFRQGRYIGTLIMFSFKNPQAFTESDRRLIQGISDYVAIAIERAELAREAQEARALHEADRLRSQFISSVSHELRTPLAKIKGYSTSLLREDAHWDKETQQEFLQTIDEKTDELLDLIDKILESAKLEAGALKLVKEPVLIPRLAQKIVEDAASRTKSHRFTLKFASSFPVVEADFRCLEQVLRNLVENAVKYSPEGGDVTIGGEVKEDRVVIAVSDEGIGIPSEYQEKVFERFYRVANPLTRRISGSGLGLSIVKGHVEAHGGRVWLESRMAKGSTFYFSLPTERDESTEPELDGIRNG
ncbi:MAG: ATP-binding protein [Chloroflexota bacterium]